MDRLTNSVFNFYNSPDEFIPLGIGIGIFILFIAVSAMFRDRNPAAARIARIGGSRADARRDRGFLQAADADPRGLLKGFVPADRTKRSHLRRKLAQAGFSKSNALRNFTLLRITLGLLLPAVFLGLVALAEQSDIDLPFAIDARLAQLGAGQIMIILAALTAQGYYFPMLWLKDRVNERTERIEMGFPNALDLLQISVEAGLGFDAAMTRVGNELAGVSPDIAFEFLSVQRQVQAGRARDAALHDMADRTGIETVRSFANVVQQSMQFGTSMADALETYSKEMREMRETRAQEMANKLPVKMSAVLASLMLPALVMLTVGPVVIRYIRYFSG
jgi:tight adherence protein C